MTDAELRDLALTHLEATTIAYPTWKSRVANGYKGKPYDPFKTDWGKAFGYLDQIGGVPAPTGLRDPRPDVSGFERVALNGRSGMTFTRDTLLDIGDYVGPEGPMLIANGCTVAFFGGRITVTGVPGQPYNVGLGVQTLTDDSFIYGEGLRIQPSRLPDGSWSTMLHDGIAVRGYRGRQTFQNCLVGPTAIKAGTSDQQAHSDVVQFQTNFDGAFRVDKLTGYVDYTGIMASDFLVRSMDLSRVNFVPMNVNPQYEHHIALYAGNPTTQAGVKLHEVYWQPAPGRTLASSFYPQSLAGGAKGGTPAGGDFVTEADL